jgi:hypothetical protein
MSGKVCPDLKVRTLESRAEYLKRKAASFMSISLSVYRVEAVYWQLESSCWVENVLTTEPSMKMRAQIRPQSHSLPHVPPVRFHSRFIPVANPVP